MSPRVTVLGPQRRPNVQHVLADLGANAVVATVTAGWQERESDDAELAQLVLTLDEPAGGPILTTREQIEAERLNALKLDRARREGTLVRAADMSAALGEIFATQSRELRSFLQQIGREQGWPEPVQRTWEVRLGEMQTRIVAKAAALLAPPAVEGADAVRSVA